MRRPSIITNTTERLVRLIPDHEFHVGFWLEITELTDDNTTGLIADRIWLTHDEIKTLALVVNHMLEDPDAE